MAAPEVEVWRVPSDSRPCAYCRQDVGADPATSCPRCDAVYHPDCWDSNGSRCAIYGCEPAPKPPAPVAPPQAALHAPDVTRPTGRVAWFAPIIVVLIVSIARMNASDRPSRTYRAPPFPPAALRHVTQPLEIEALLDATEAAVPASPDDLPCLIEEAQALELSASALMEAPRGRLTSDVRTLLREATVADLAALKRAHRLYRRCEMTSPEHGDDVVRVATTIGVKRRLLIDLWIVKGTD